MTLYQQLPLPYRPYKHEDIPLTMYVLFTSLKYYCISSFFSHFLVFHLFHTSEEMFKMLLVIGDGVWLAHVYCVLCVFFLFCHLYYMGQENCGLLVIYAFKYLPLAFCVFVRMAVMVLAWMGRDWFQKFRKSKL